MRRLLELFRPHKRHSYWDLGMGLIKNYSLIIPRSHLQTWLERGWIHAPGFHNFHYAPRFHETVILNKPKTLTEIGENHLIGRRIMAFGTAFGTYGMGGPGFLGFTLDLPGENVMVYAVWGAAQYALIDQRVIECHPRYYDTVRPWISHVAGERFPSWDDLTPALIGGVIENVLLSPTQCILAVSRGAKTHTIELLKNDPRLPPLGGGSARKDAFSDGAMGDFIVFQYDDAVLHVS